MSHQQVANLPGEFTAVLHRLRGDHEQLDAVLRKAHQFGWQQTTLAAALGVSRQNIGRRIDRASYKEPSTVEVPTP